jgi:hypothetical protein
MDDKETLLAFALAAAMGLVARGATPAEVRDMAWTYAQFAVNGQPKDENV